jgi:hypothetical protein
VLLREQGHQLRGSIFFRAEMLFTSTMPTPAMPVTRITATSFKTSQCFRFFFPCMIAQLVMCHVELLAFFADLKTPHLHLHLHCCRSCTAFWRLFLRCLADSPGSPLGRAAALLALADPLPACSTKLTQCQCRCPSTYSSTTSALRQLTHQRRFYPPYHLALTGQPFYF